MFERTAREHWAAALLAFDSGAPEPLAELVRAGVPDFAREAVADVVGGHRRPSKKAGAKLKVPPEQVGDVALMLYQHRAERRAQVRDKPSRITLHETAAEGAAARPAWLEVEHWPPSAEYEDTGANSDAALSEWNRQRRGRASANFADMCAVYGIGRSAAYDLIAKIRAQIEALENSPRVVGRLGGKSENENPID